MIIQFPKPKFVRLVKQRKHGAIAAEYKCKCGKTFIAAMCKVRSGHKRSCGCLSKMAIAYANSKRDKAQPYRQRLYNIWRNMIRRCYVLTSTSYPYYGAKGIQVCKQWLNSFDSFYTWALGNGYSDLLTLDRKRNDRNYKPSNCKWSDRSEQNKNKSYAKAKTAAPL